MDSSKIYVTIGYYVIALEERLKWPVASPNPVRKGNYLVPVTSVLLGLSTLAVLLRLYTRAFIIYKLGVDDFLIVPGYLAAVATNIGQIFSLQAGWGLHVWDFKLENTRKLAISGYTVQITMAFCCMFTKLSILLSYLRFSPPVLRFWVQATMIFIVAWTLGLIIPSIVACNPPHLYWDSYIRTPEIAAKCLSPYVVRIIQYMLCAFNIFSDIIVMVLPIPTVWHLQMPTKQKWSVVLIFLIWVIATIAAILRLSVTVKTFEQYDTLWYGYDLWVYVAVEAHLAVICACAPGLKPLLVRVWPTFDKMRFSGRKKLSQSTGTETTGMDETRDPDAVIELRVKPRSPRVSRRLSGYAERAANSESESQLCRPADASQAGPNVPAQAYQLPMGTTRIELHAGCPQCLALQNHIHAAHMSPSQDQPTSLPNNSVHPANINTNLQTSSLQGMHPHPIGTNFSPARESPPPAYPSWSPTALRGKVLPQIGPQSRASTSSKFSFSLSTTTEIDTVTYPERLV
ncbi:hypothetical protein ABW19_dt0210507 [Dactylella cylindrospora]|nr:hypothetical protein ABW19_dt0210507 [Dactylella cylindrospora]